MWLRLGRLTGFRVAGNSMKPTLADGDIVLLSPSKEFRTGDIVLARHPFKQSVKILKRIESIMSNGNYFLAGDDPAESTDSRSFGAIHAKDIIGKVVCLLK